MDIFEAIAKNDVGLIEELLNKGTDINIKQNQKLYTPLIVASRDNTKDVIEYLLKRGADVTIKTKGGYTALMMASRSRNKDIIELLLNYGSDVNTRDINDWTPLILASAYNSNPDIINLLLDRGADINARTDTGVTSLIAAVTLGFYNIVQLLIERGANVNIITNTGNNALMAELYKIQPNINIVKLLLEHGININIKSNDGSTPLIFAIKGKNIDIIKLLLEYGADPFEKYKDKDLIELCKDDICKKLISEYRWKRLYKRDIETAQKYSRSTVLPKDVWTLILLNKRQQMLCSKLSSSKNKEVLEFFAVELEIPITEKMTKGQLCGLISRQLAYGKGYKNVTQEVQTYKNQIIALAKKFNIDINQPMNNILKDLGDIF
jgi:ankyrin repeat protein